MKNISSGQLIFAGTFVICFIGCIIYAYRKDFQKSGFHYRKVYLLLIFAALAYALMYAINRAFINL